MFVADIQLLAVISKTTTLRHIVLFILTIFLLADSFAQTMDTSNEFYHLPDTLAGQFHPQVLILKPVNQTADTIQTLSLSDKIILDSTTVQNGIIYRTSRDFVPYEIKIAFKIKSYWTVYTLYNSGWEESKSFSGIEPNNDSYTITKKNLCDNCSDLLLIGISTNNGHSSDGDGGGWSEYYGSTTVWDINKKSLLFSLPTQDSFESWPADKPSKTEKVDEIKPIYSINYDNGIITISETLLLQKSSGIYKKSSDIYKYKLINGQLIRQK